MARIRTVKPDFWDDVRIGGLTRDARLLFLATFNIADDEGLLRWAPAYLRSRAFMYDGDITNHDMSALMHELAAAGLVHVYSPSRDGQHMAFIIKFRQHQRINRPQPTKFHAPPLADPTTVRMYAERDSWTCGHCQAPVTDGEQAIELIRLTTDVSAPQRIEVPSNLRLVHASPCLRATHQPPTLAALQGATSGGLAQVLPFTETRRTG